MTEIHCSGVLFDLDGVLIDSTPAVTRVWRQWALEHGFNPEEVVERVHGRPSLITVREYLPNADHAAENREIERREMQDADGIITLPGARELLGQLPANRWTIATSCTRALAEVRLRAAGLPIPERMVTSTDVTQGKPHPEPFLKAASKLGFPLLNASSWKMFQPGFAPARRLGAESSLSALLSPRQNCGARAPILF